MKYVGSKNRLSKVLAPIIQSYINSNTECYIEPFVGGANMIDKIVFYNKIGYDINKYLIALLNYIKNESNVIPSEISETEYNLVKNNKSNYEEWYVGLVGFNATFGAKFFGGYARGFKSDRITKRNISAESLRNIEKQRKLLADIKFFYNDFRELRNLKNCVIYCDPPYKGTLKYDRYNFDYNDFYKWCKLMSKDNIVLISEYYLPEDDFKVIFEKSVNVNIDSLKIKGVDRSRIEKLFIVKEVE